MAECSSQDSSSNGHIPQDTTNISQQAWTLTSDQSEFSTTTSEDSDNESGNDSDISSNCYISQDMKQEPSESHGMYFAIYL